MKTETELFAELVAAQAEYNAASATVAEKLDEHGRAAKAANAAHAKVQAALRAIQDAAMERAQ